MTSNVTISELMTGPELRANREALGVTTAWLADRLDIAERTVQRWEAGDTAPGAFIDDDLAELWAEHDRQVAARVSHDPVVVGWTGWPAGWARAVAWRVRQQTGARICTIAEALNGYAGDNIWQDLIMAIQSEQDSADQDELDPEGVEMAVIGGRVWRWDTARLDPEWLDTGTPDDWRD